MISLSELLESDFSVNHNKHNYTFLYTPSSPLHHSTKSTILPPAGYPLVKMVKAIFYWIETDVTKSLSAIHPQASVLSNFKFGLGMVTIWRKVSIRVNMLY